MNGQRVNVEIDKIILLSNFLIFRLDAFMNNLIEFSSVALYTLSMAKYLNMIPSVPYFEIIKQIFTGSLLAHLIYSLVYIINDLIDYQNNIKLKAHSSLYSFYKYRLIHYFNASHSIIIYLLCLYVLYLLATMWMLPSLAYGFIIMVVLLLVQSIVHSLFTGLIRGLTFLFLRVEKQILFLMIFTAMTSFSETTVLIVMALPWIGPYVMFALFSYMKQKNLIKKYNTTKYLLSMFLIPSIIPLLISITYLSSKMGYTIYHVMISLSSSYLMVLTPFLAIRMILRYFFGPENPNFYIHIKRLTLATIFTVFVVCIEVPILASL